MERRATPTSALQNTDTITSTVTRGTTGTFRVSSCTHQRSRDAGMNVAYKLTKYQLKLAKPENAQFLLSRALCTNTWKMTQGWRFRRYIAKSEWLLSIPAK